MKFRCPVCFFSSLPYPPEDYHICPCCGTEFGNDDQDATHEQLRERWIANGLRWFFKTAPPKWEPWMQLVMGGYNMNRLGVTVTASNDATMANGNEPPPLGVRSDTRGTTGTLELRVA